MPFNVQNFASDIDKFGIAKVNTAEVIINVPKSLHVDDEIGFKRHLTFRAEGVDIPGRSIQSLDYMTEYKPTAKIAYKANYIDISMTFLMSADMREKLFFEAWQDCMVGRIRDRNFDQRDGGPERSSNFNVGYWKNYVANIEIRQWKWSLDGQGGRAAARRESAEFFGVPVGSQDKGTRFPSHLDAAEVVYHCELYDAYPYTINPIQANWQDNTGLQRLVVTFAYRYFKDASSEFSARSEAPRPEAKASILPKPPAPDRVLVQPRTGNLQGRPVQ